MFQRKVMQIEAINKKDIFVKKCQIFNSKTVHLTSKELHINEPIFTLYK